MPTIASDIQIAAEPDRVFEALLDTAAYEEWVTIHAGWPDSPPELKAGASLAQAISLMGKSATIHWTVSELQPPSTIALEGQGPMGLTVSSSYRLAIADGGTEVRYESTVDGGPLPLTGRLGGIVVNKVRAASEASLANLKARVESDDRPAEAGKRAQPRTGLSFTIARKRIARWRGQDRRPFRPRTSKATDAQMLAAIEENTRAINALTEQLARANEQLSPVSWLTAPMELLRRTAAAQGEDAGKRAENA